MMSKEHLKRLESWINKEINITIKQVEETSKYTKARHESYLNALKKVQARIQHKKILEVDEILAHKIGR